LGRKQLKRFEHVLLWDAVWVWQFEWRAVTPTGIQRTTLPPESSGFWREGGIRTHGGL